MPEPPSKTGLSLLRIALILGIFFFIVFVLSVLMLPDHGRSLLKLGLNSAGGTALMLPSHC